MISMDNGIVQVKVSFTVNLRADFLQADNADYKKATVNFFLRGLKHFFKRSSILCSWKNLVVDMEAQNE